MTSATRWPFWGAIALIAFTFALGGSSRADVVQLALLWPLAIGWTAIVICFAPALDWRSVRWPAGVLAALAAIMLLQLVPLPFDWWTAMPGREAARDALALTGRTDIAHGWSLMPDRTLNSLFSLAVPIAVVVTAAALDARERRRLLPWLLGAIGAHLLLGFLQLLVGGSGRFRPFNTTDIESAVGVFANRNHAAVLLAAALPLAACLAVWPARRPTHRTGLRLAAVAGAGLALLVIPAMGSRAGLLMAAVGLAWSLVLLWPDLRRGAARQAAAARWGLALALIVGLAVLVALAVLGARDEAIRRLLDLDAYNDMRIKSLPISIEMMRGYLPFGSGFGTFEPMYRAAEPRALLSLRYLNHAHNDYVELISDAGIAGAALLLAAIAWYTLRTARLFARVTPGAPESAPDRPSRHGVNPAKSDQAFDRRLALAASGVLLIAALASVTDYPLRTPVWMLVAALSAVWLACPSKTDGSPSR